MYAVFKYTKNKGYLEIVDTIFNSSSHSPIYDHCLTMIIDNLS